MERHIIDILCFATCTLSLIVAVIAMVKADDNDAVRRFTAILAAVFIYFNEKIGFVSYLFLASLMECTLTVAGIGFILVLVAVIMLLPLIAVLRWLIH